MLAAARTSLPQFETGWWSLYSLPGQPASDHYHSYVVELLQKLARETHDGFWYAAAARFRGFAHDPPTLRLLSPVQPMRVQRSPGALVWLSKPAQLTLQAGRAQTSVTVGAGLHRIPIPAVPSGRVELATLTARDRFGNTSRLSVPAVLSLPANSPEAHLTVQQGLALPIGVGGPALILPAPTAAMNHRGHGGEPVQRLRAAGLVQRLGDAGSFQPLRDAGFFQPLRAAGASAVSVNVAWGLTPNARTHLLTTTRGALASGLDVVLQFEPPKIPLALAARAKGIEAAKLVHGTGALIVIVRGATTLSPSAYLRLGTVIRTHIRASAPRARVFIETPTAQQAEFVDALGASMRAGGRAAALDGLVLRLGTRAMTPDLRLPPPPAPTLNARTYGRLRFHLRRAFRQTQHSPRLPIIVAGAGNDAVTALRAAACQPNLTAISISRPPGPRTIELARVAKLARSGSLRPCDRIAAPPALTRPSPLHRQTGVVLACQRDCRYAVALTNDTAVIAGHSGSLKGGIPVRIAWPGLTASTYKALIVTAPRLGAGPATVRSLLIQLAPAPLAHGANAARPLAKP